MPRPTLFALFAGGLAVRPDRGADRQDHRPREDPRRQEGRPPQDGGRPAARDDLSVVARDEEIGTYVRDIGTEAEAGGGRERKRGPEKEAGNGRGGQLAASAATAAAAATPLG